MTRLVKWFEFISLRDTYSSQKKKHTQYNTNRANSSSRVTQHKL